MFCFLLTIYLISQELFNFAVVKPTTTSKEEQVLRITDIPDVVICLDPAINTTVLEKFGYFAASYYRGLSDQDNFIGWNGIENETKSSNEILDEALVVKKHFVKIKTFITFAKYKNEFQQFFKAVVTLKSLTLPYGRCLSITPPPVEGKANMNTLTNTLYLKFNETVFKRYKDKGISAKIYFMGRTNSFNIYPDHSVMAGDTLKLELNKEQKYISTYKTKISRSIHVPGDPLLKCSEYTPNNSFNDCTQNELLSSIHNILGCTPPLLGTDSERTCNETFNLSREKEKDIERLFLPIYQHDVRFKCRTPCITDKYNTRLLHNAPHTETIILVVFDRTLSVAHSSFSINSQTFLTRLGGSVSSGRTLLWVLLSLLGTCQVNRFHFYYEI